MDYFDNKKAPERRRRSGAVLKVVVLNATTLQISVIILISTMLLI